MVEMPNAQLAMCLNGIAKGDLKAIGPIYRHYQAAVFGFVCHLVLDEHLAKDIVHETFLVISDKSLRFDTNGPAKFSTWLCAIAKNKVKDLQSSGKKFIDQGEEFISEQSDNEAWSYSIDYENDELSEIIAGCRDKLPMAQREAIFWTYYMSMHQDEVALIMGSPLGTIKSRLFNALEKMKQCLSKSEVVWSNKE